MSGGVVLFGTGSPILVDVEESLHRAGRLLAAGIRNREGACHLPDGVRAVPAEQAGPDLTALPFLVPLFTPAHRQTAAQEARALGFTRPFTLVDPSVPAPRRLEIGEGGYVNAGCTLGGGSLLGAFAFINRGASLGHHAHIGAFVSIGPGAVIAGHVTLGHGVVLGAGAVVLPELTIGDNAVVGAGSVVTKDVPAGCLAIGNPARIVKDAIGGYRGLALDLSGA